MENDRTLGIQNWGGYYRTPPLKGNLGLQLMPSVGDRDIKPPFFSGAGYLHRECGDPDPSTMHMDFPRDPWYHGNRDSGKMLHLFQGNHYHHHHHHHSHSYGSLLSEVSTMSGFPMPTPVEIPREEKAPAVENPSPDPPQHEDAATAAAPSKKRQKGAGRVPKTPKPRKAKPPKEEDSGKTTGRGRSVMKSMNMVINGINLDLLGMPTPVCTCTGQPQQCYRWGAGGWQSACCTTSISHYPLPMSIKRRGARIAGRKMSHGAFKKVLEKLAGDGQDFSSPIDLKLFWAKHGTNKFVTIR